MPTAVEGAIETTVGVAVGLVVSLEPVNCHAGIVGRPGGERAPEGDGVEVAVSLAPANCHAGIDGRPGAGIGDAEVDGDSPEPLLRRSALRDFSSC